MNSEPLTAAEFAAIGERVRATAGTNDWRHADKDRARLHAALERLIPKSIRLDGNYYWVFCDATQKLMCCSTKDDAIDVLLGGGK